MAGQTFTASNLVPKPVIDLVTGKYFIPDYQRGYRWTETQVIQLLDDIWAFAKNPNKASDNDGEKPYYCLQPVVVKELSDGTWEVIDGQQRLTTITLFIHYCNEMWGGKRGTKEPKISYETREASSKFISSLQINNPDDELSDDDINKCLDLIDLDCGEFEAIANIDFFHIARAYKAIHYWVTKQGTSLDEHLLQSTFLHDSKVIWYEVEDDVSNNSVNIFTRINIGKIPLTNSELIKALFLMTGNFSDSEASLKQVQIASEWDTIEKALRNDEFWFFIYNPKNPLKYENRIEYIFDLMKGKTEECEFYHTFNKFHEDFVANTLNGKADIDKIWLAVKRYFLTFEEWFNDYELYHYIGFLVECNEQKAKSKITECISHLYNLSNGSNKDVFKEKLKAEIRKEVKCQVDQLDYGDRDTRKVLLLFNIVTVLQTQKSDMRYPFYKYKNEDWDIEHVCSQTDRAITDDPKRRAWAYDILDYFIGSTEENVVSDFINDEEEDEEKRGICSKIQSMLQESRIDDNEFSEVYKDVQHMFEEDKPVGDKNSIANLALLDSKTNRSYGNAFFPIKRKRIIDNDSKGIFVPIATKNLFLKYYSKKSDNLMSWGESDARDYLASIKTILYDYLPSQE